MQMRRSRLLCGLLALTLLTGPTLAEGSYTVRSGDTLSQLANRFSVTLSELITLNAITNPDVIYVGQVLRLPDGATVPAETPAAPEADAKATAESPAEQPAAERPLTSRELYEARAEYLNKQRSDRGVQIVAAARNYLGTPYRYGGMSTEGLDCSGLVVRAMRSTGMDVPHNAAALYKLGEKVTYAELQPGDLVFFNTVGQGISHVGIWVGENKFLHASSGARRVQVDRLSGYYAKRLVGARRLQ